MIYVSMYRLTQLQTIRKARGLSQAALAELAGVPKWTIQKHERDVKTDAYLSVAHKLAVALEVPIEALFLPEITSKVLKAA